MIMGGRQPHAVVIPFPAQGHVAPLMKLALHVAAEGVKVTFVNAEFIHEKVMASLPKKLADDQDRSRQIISFVSLPDGSEAVDDLSDPVKRTQSLHRAMPGYFEDFILKINQSNVTCVMADTSVGWALEVAKKLGIQAVAVCPFGGACLALALQVPQLLEAEIIDKDGTVLTDEPISVSKDVPAWTSSEIGWKSSDPVIQKFLFGFFSIVPKYAKYYDWILCNSVYELDSAALKLVPNIKPIGPLLASNYHLGTFAGNFWPEDSTCLEWLDKQTSGSVIYVAFGSTTKANLQQLEELVLGLELTNLPFLMVVRSNFMEGSLAKFPDGFINRVSERAKFVEWAPQEKVLAHPSVACFMSHCGWNSTMEGLSMGVPFICWPYFADQFCNKNYICDVWKIGLGLVQDENGMVTRHEICGKIKTLLSSDAIYKANALHVKEVARNSFDDGRSSFNNFNDFIQHIKGIYARLIISFDETKKYKYI